MLLEQKEVRVVVLNAKDADGKTSRVRGLELGTIQQRFFGIHVSTLKKSWKNGETRNKQRPEQHVETGRRWCEKRRLWPPIEDQPGCLIFSGGFFPLMTELFKNAI